MRIGRRIDNKGRGGLPSVLDLRDDFTFNVRLKKDDVIALFFCLGAAVLLNARKRLRAVYLLLALP